MEHTPESELNQDLVANGAPDPQQVVKQRVSAAVYRTVALGSNIDCDAIADAAIAAHLEALIEMELPEEAIDEAAACPTPAGMELGKELRNTIYQNEFRAILRSLAGGAK